MEYLVVERENFQNRQQMAFRVHVYKHPKIFPTEKAGQSFGIIF